MYINTALYIPSLGPICIIIVVFIKNYGPKDRGRMINKVLEIIICSAFINMGF